MLNKSILITISVFLLLNISQFIKCMDKKFEHNSQGKYLASGVSENIKLWDTTDNKAVMPEINPLYSKMLNDFLNVKQSKSVSNTIKFLDDAKKFFITTTDIKFTLLLVDLTHIFQYHTRTEFLPNENREICSHISLLEKLVDFQQALQGIIKDPTKIENKEILDLLLNDLNFIRYLDKPYNFIRKLKNLLTKI